MQSGSNGERRGRPRRGLGDRLGTIVWFDAVSRAAGGASAYRLEKEFCPDQFIKLSDGTSQRPGQWDRYRRGEVSPGAERLNAVEGLYPSTAKWVALDLWQLINQGTSTADDRLLQIIGQESSKLAQFLLLVSKATQFTAPKVGIFSIIQSLFRQGGINSITALTAAFLYLLKKRSVNISEDTFEETGFGIREAIYFLLVYEFSERPLSLIKNELSRWYIENLQIPLLTHEIYGNYVKYAVEENRNIINFALDKKIIRNTSQEKSDFYFGLWMIGAMDMSGHKLEYIDDFHLVVQLSYFKKVIKENLKKKNMPLFLWRSENCDFLKHFE